MYMVVFLVSIHHADVTMGDSVCSDESEKRLHVSNTHSEVFLVHHLDSNILAQLCD